jgi:hypothetical protein
MKEVKIAYLNLNLKQKESIETLKEWMYKLWKTKEYTNGYSIYKWLFNFPYNTDITAVDLENLRKLWDTYLLYQKQNNESTEHNN